MEGGQTSGHQEGGRSCLLVVRLVEELLDGGPLEPEITKSSHLRFGLKLVLIPKAVRLHWPVLPGRPGLVEVRPGWQALSWGGNKTSRATGRNNLQFTVYSLQCTVQSSPVLSLYINSSPLHVGLSLPRNTASLDLLLGEHTLRTEGGGEDGKMEEKIENPKSASDHINRAISEGNGSRNRT